MTDKKSNTIDRALMAQQKEQLRQLVLQRFIADYGKGKKSNIDNINIIVNEYFKNNKVTDATLKVLKQQVVEATSGTGSIKKSQQLEPLGRKQEDQHSQGRKEECSQNECTQNQYASQPQEQERASEKVRSQQSKRSGVSQQSNISSKVGAPRSVYMAEGDEDDEWATLVKFDTELYKKEQELEKVRQKEFKKKIKNELDKQIYEKGRRKNEEVKDEDAYVNLLHYQINAYDQREQDKHTQYKKKIQIEKQQRDKQVRDEYMRKKLEQKREKELDDLLVQKIKQELEMEQQESVMKRNKERERLQRMMKENEDYRKKAMEDARMEKEAETNMQNQYISLLNQLEEQREQERRMREDKMKKVMGVYAESIVKDQKDIIKQEDDRMMKNILDQNEREKIEEEKKKHRQHQQKLQMREFLNQQIEEKKKRREEEDELNKRQAEIWKQDFDNYNDHESRKMNYIKEVNLKHAEILKNQMADRQWKKGKKAVPMKMNNIELLQNKDRLKEIAYEEPALGQNLKKTEIS